MLTAFSPVWKHLRADKCCMGFWVKQGEWSIPAYVLVAFAHPSGLVVAWDPQKDRNMFWAAVCPHHLGQYLAHSQSSVNIWQINK